MSLRFILFYFLCEKYISDVSAIFYVGQDVDAKDRQ